MPAQLAIPTLLQGAIGTRWARIPGGTYSYIQRIIDRSDSSSMSIYTERNSTSVRRNRNGIEIQSGDLSMVADKLIIATPPHQVLKLIEDPSDDESRFFCGWRENVISTVIHTDTTLYEPWEFHGYTEFDVFEGNGDDAGYNAYLNRLCGIGDNHPVKYFLAYNLKDRIDPDKILHTQEHRTPLYQSESFQFIEAIKAMNGENNTYFVGSYLYNGLHEGAARSAVAVRDLILDRGL